MQIRYVNTEFVFFSFFSTQHNHNDFSFAAFDSIRIGTNSIMGPAGQMCRHAMAIGWTITVGCLASRRQIFCVIAHRWFIVFVAIATNAKTSIPIVSTRYVYVSINLVPIPAFLHSPWVCVRDDIVVCVLINFQLWRHWTMKSNGVESVGCDYIEWKMVSSRQHGFIQMIKQHTHSHTRLPVQLSRALCIRSFVRCL